VLKKYVIAFSVAALCSSGIAAAQAQSGQTQSPERPPQDAPAPQTQGTTDSRAGSDQPAAQAASRTVTGCVYREADVPGRAPNVAERAGVMEDYILAVSGGSADASGAGTPGAVGTSGAAAGQMYKLELIADDKLRAVVGKRVEVTGRVDAEAGDARASGTPATSDTDRAIGRDRVNLPEFEVTSIREVEGTCPAKPSAR
jgi:hypothetical protein